ncbi:MAG: NAD-dependent epimerase/dehydratase family protein [Acidobacteriota bacterium]|nr:NAD-dependent epimerase/dehydratase family protein [Acidobacteriota bacterium]
MKVLVTGATGFTGRWLVRYLLKEGDDVRALVRPGSSERAAELRDLGAELVTGDLADVAALAVACHGVEVAYHIAATYRTAGQPASAYRAVNVQGTDRLLKVAAAAGVARVVHCSTGGVHGHIENPPATEDAPLAPGDIYQASKLEGEQLARAHGDAGEMEVVVARPIGIYGPGDTRFLKLFRGLSRRRFPMLGNGSGYYHLTFIEDLVRGFRLCATVAEAAGRTYLLAGPRYTTLTELVALIAAECGVSPPRRSWPVWPVWLAGALCECVCVPLRIEPPLFRRRVDFYTKSRAFDPSRSRRELGFEPKVDLEEGIHRTAVWYREQGWL